MNIDDGVVIRAQNHPSDYLVHASALYNNFRHHIESAILELVNFEDEFVIRAPKNTQFINLSALLYLSISQAILDPPS